MANLVKNEDRNKPLSDSKILELIKEEFKVDIGRRTITKYRKHLNIASSTDRKNYMNLKDKILSIYQTHYTFVYI